MVRRVTIATVARDSSGPTGTAVDELFAQSEPVPLVYWRAFTGVRTAVLLAAAAAVLAFVAGLSRLSAASFVPTGPLAVLVPAGGAEVLGLVEVLAAFLLAIAAAGMGRRYRLAWRVGIGLLSALLVVPFVTATATDVLVFVVAALSVPAVAIHREEFDRRIELSPFQTAALLSFAGVQVYGTVGTFAMREQFVGVASLTDAFYYVIVTGTTVGYGDATPTTQVTKLFTLSVIVLATVSFTVASGSLIIPAIESRLSSALGTMNASELALLEDHILVLGYGDLTEPLLDELGDDADVVVITDDDDAGTALESRDVTVLDADPTDADALREARIGAAAGVVVATEDDARDTLAIVAVARTDPDVRVVAAATDRKHADALREVGADSVVSPAVIGGRLLGQSVLGDDASLDDPERPDEGETDEPDE